MGENALGQHHSCMSNDTQFLKVFLAEDSAPIRSRLHGLLADANMDVVGEAASPEACISGILDLQPDVVVLDIQLEGGTGLEVLKAVRAADPSVAFVVFSNSSATAYRKRYLSEGARRFLDKSTEFDLLPQALASAATVH
jgi:DNA-binding NarL/FixJ family response regulator